MAFKTTRPKPGQGREGGRKRLEENRGQQDCNAVVKSVLAPCDFSHGEHSSALTTLSYKAPPLRLFFTGTFFFFLGVFFTREISKTPVPSAPCKPSFDVPPVFLRLADSRQTTTQKWGENTARMCFCSQRSLLAEPSDLHIRSSTGDVCLSQVRAGLTGCPGPENPDKFQLTCSAHHCTRWFLKPKSVGKVGAISRVSGVS